MVEAAKKTLRIDSDSHFLPLLDPESLAALLPGFEPRLVDMIARDAAVFSDPNARSGGFSGTAAGQQVGALVGGISARGGSSGPVGHAAFEERAKLLPETGFDMQVLIPDGVFLERPFKSPLDVAESGIDPAIRYALCVGYNNAVAVAQSNMADTFIGGALVPFGGGSVEQCCDEAVRGVRDLGLKAIVINDNWAGRNYDSLDLYPFWQTVNDLDVPIIVHPAPFACQVTDHAPRTYRLGWERMRRLHISNYLGFAFEYMVALASLTLGGVFKEFPNLRFCFYEAGGSWLPWVMFTLDHTYNVERQCARCDIPPSEQIMRSCFIAVEPYEEPIVQTIAQVGSQNFLVGSDYPHPPSTFPNTAVGIERLEGLTQQDKDNILGLNARAVFQVP